LWSVISNVFAEKLNKIMQKNPTPETNQEIHHFSSREPKVMPQYQDIIFVQNASYKPYIFSYKTEMEARCCRTILHIIPSWQISDRILTQQMKTHYTPKRYTCFFLVKVNIRNTFIRVSKQVCNPQFKNMPIPSCNPIKKHNSCQLSWRFQRQLFESHFWVSQFSSRYSVHFP